MRAAESEPAVRLLLPGLLRVPMFTCDVTADKRDEIPRCAAPL